MPMVVKTLSWRITQEELLTDACRASVNGCNLSAIVRSSRAHTDTMGSVWISGVVGHCMTASIRIH